MVKLLFEKVCIVLINILEEVIFLFIDFLGDNVEIVCFNFKIFDLSFSNVVFINFFFYSE